MQMVFQMVSVTRKDIARTRCAFNNAGLLNLKLSVPAGVDKGFRVPDLPGFGERIYWSDYLEIVHSHLNGDFGLIALDDLPVRALVEAPNVRISPGYFRRWTKELVGRSMLKLVPV